MKDQNDLIYRQDAIDAISCNITVTGRNNAETVARTIGTFADRIKALPPAQPQQWIPVTERLPEDGERVLTYHKDGSICMNYFLGEKFEWFWGSVVAWMPLPEPYREESHERTE